MAAATLQWPDYVVMVSFLAVSLSIGVYHAMTGGRQRTIAEFILGDRRLAVLPTAISLFVSFTSAIVLLSGTAELYLYGVQYFVMLFVTFAVVLVFVERLVIPWIYPLNLVSINDYLERRYRSRLVRLTGSISAIVGAVLYMGLAMYAPSSALETATGLPITVSIPLMALVCVIYTALGGIRAVVWTDVFQFLIMVSGMLAIFIKGVLVAGGISNVLDVCRTQGRLDPFNWSVDPTVRHTVWGFVFGHTVYWFKNLGLDQSAMQRYAGIAPINKSRLYASTLYTCLWKCAPTVRRDHDASLMSR